MKEIKINNETYIKKSEIKNSNKELEKELQKQKQISEKYEKKYKELWIKYRSLYMQYKNQSDRMQKNRCKYVEIIHKLQCEVINQASIEDLLKEVERMSEIEKEI